MDSTTPSAISRRVATTLLTRGGGAATEAFSGAVGGAAFLSSVPLRGGKLVAILELLLSTTVVADFGKL
jgi:hypothetical protein